MLSHTWVMELTLIRTTGISQSQRLRSSSKLIYGSVSNVLHIKKLLTSVPVLQMDESKSIFSCFFGPETYSQVLFIKTLKLSSQIHCV